MTLPPNITYALFAVVAVVVIGGLVITLMRGQRVGTLKLQGRFGLDLAVTCTTGEAMYVRLTVAREGGAKVQMRIVVSMEMYLERINPADAMILAQFLETASSRLRAP